MRTVVPLTAGGVSRKPCDTLHAENHSSPPRACAPAAPASSTSAASKADANLAFFTSLTPCPQARRSLTRSKSVIIVVVPIMPLLARCPAFEVRRIVGAAGAGVDSHLGIDAQRTRTVHYPCRGMRCDDALGCLAFLDPILQRRQHVEG